MESLLYRAHDQSDQPHAAAGESRRSTTYVQWRSR